MCNQSHVVVNIFKYDGAVTFLNRVCSTRCGSEKSLEFTRFYFSNKILLRIVESLKNPLDLATKSLERQQCVAATEF